MNANELITRTQILCDDIGVDIFKNLLGTTPPERFLFLIAFCYLNKIAVIEQASDKLKTMEAAQRKRVYG